MSKLVAHKIIKGQIHCLTGLHIGGSREEMQIAGVDLPVIKHPVTGEPYIPGSSLKGKLRSELEHKEGKFSAKGSEPCNCAECDICRIFGPHKNPNHSLGPTRILVRDAFFSEETRKEYETLVREKGVSYLEKKTENIINRKTGTAEHPRTLERVPAGAKFDFEIVLRIFDSDNAESLVTKVKEAMSLVQKSYLGASGSRGSGKVEFQNLTLDGQPFQL